MSKQRAIIIDLDGTLANHDHRKHFVNSEQKEQDWTLFYKDMHLDSVNEWCRKIIARFSDFKSIFVTGRPEEYELGTRRWIDDNRITNQGYRLLMRKNKDYRGDEIVKEELYKTYIEPFYDVLFALDDRPKVCRKWRELGLVCLQCNDAEF